MFNTYPQEQRWASTGEKVSSSWQRESGTSAQQSTASTRKYWMIYRGPGFLAVIWFGSSPNPFSPFPSVNSTGDTQEDWERETSCWRERRGAGERVSRIIWSQESLVLFEPFNILWVRTINNNQTTNKNKHITDSYSTPDNSKRQPTALKKHTEALNPKCVKYSKIR